MIIRYLFVWFYERKTIADATENLFQRILVVVEMRNIIQQCDASPYGITTLSHHQIMTFQFICVLVCASNNQDGIIGFHGKNSPRIHLTAVPLTTTMTHKKYLRKQQKELETTTKLGKQEYVRKFCE